MIWGTIPAGPGLVIQNLELGIFYITAFAVVGILGLVLAGWGSANKYGVLGGLRAAAQLISYEIPIILVVVAVAMLAQSLNLQVIVEHQNPVLHVVVLPLGMVIFFIAGLAEVGRTPFDIYHAESEVVGGPFVEYSGAHWAVFFLAEYINTFAIAAVASILFLGGWLGPGPAWLGVVWFLLKVLALVLVVFWVRGTLPRLRIDQVLSFAWKGLFELTMINLVVTAILATAMADIEPDGSTFSTGELWLMALVNWIVFFPSVYFVGKVLETKPYDETMPADPADIYPVASEAEPAEGAVD